MSGAETPLSTLHALQDAGRLMEEAARISSGVAPAARASSAAFSMLESKRVFSRKVMRASAMAKPRARCSSLLRGRLLALASGTYSAGG